MLKLIIINFIIQIIKTEIKLSFKRYYNKKEIYFNTLIRNDIITSIYIGTPPQKLEISIRMFDYSTFVLNTSTITKNKYLPKFSEKNSSSFQKLMNNSIIYGGEAFDIAYLGKDIFTFNNNKTLIKFMIVSKITNDTIYFDYTNKLSPSHSGVLGLNLLYELESLIYSNILTQLFQNHIIKYCSFTFNFNNNDEGELILGKSYYYDDNIYLFRKNEMFLSKDPKIWGINFDNVTFDNEIIEKCPFKAQFKIEMGVILINNIMKESFKKKFFQQYFDNGLCNENVTDDRFTTFFMCDDSIDIKKFPDIKFYMKDINFELILNYKDLFIKKDGKIYFLIIFQKNAKTWELGLPIFKKYSIIFDMDNKVIIFVKNKNKELLSFLILFLIILIVVLIIIIKIFRNKKKRIKAIELDNEVYQKNLNTKLI